MGPLLLLVTFVPAGVEKSVRLSDGNEMPSVNLGTCCGSDPKIGLVPWLTQASNVYRGGKVGVDTAWDYHDQRDIAAILANATLKREQLFITTKIPTGFGNRTDCAADPAVVMRYMRENVAQLGVEKVDLALLHHPCDKGGAEPTTDSALWKGLLQAQQAGMVTSIGVSNYNKAQLEAVSSKTDAESEANTSAIAAAIAAWSISASIWPFRRLASLAPMA